MSDKFNDQWLEDAKEHFEQALVDEDLEMARAIVEDCRDAGFDIAADKLEVELNKSQDEYERE